jgi:hypothetical protein
MSWNLKGVPFHGEFSSADASALSEANSRFTLFPAGFIKAGTTITLKSSTEGTDTLLGSVVIITDILISIGASALAVQVYDGADNTVDAGELVAKAQVLINTNTSIRLFVPHYCMAGTYPKVKTSGAGQVDVTIHGLISDVGF